MHTRYLEKFQAALLLSSLFLNFFGCSQMDVSNQKPSTSRENPQTSPPPALKPNDNGNDNRLPNDIVCTSNALAGLIVNVLFAPGLSPAGKVRLVGGPELEEYPLTGAGGLRLKGADGKIRPWMTSGASGAFEKAGTFQVVVETLGKVFKKDNVVVQKDECHVKPEHVSIEVTAPSQIQLDETKDYYPFGNGSLFELDPKTGTGKIVGQNNIYTEVEVVRILTFTETSGSGPESSVSAMSREEKVVAGKIKLGSFMEQGIDRGPLPTGAAQDDGGRALYAKM